MTQNMNLSESAQNEIINTMIDAALSGINLENLYTEQDIRKALRSSLAQKYPEKKFTLQKYDGSCVLAVSGEINDHIIHTRASGLGIKSTPTLFKAKSFIDLFTCFVLLDEAR